MIELDQVMGILAECRFLYQDIKIVWEEAVDFDSFFTAVCSTSALEYNAANATSIISLPVQFEKIALLETFLQILPQMLHLRGDSRVDMETIYDNPPAPHFKTMLVSVSLNRLEDGTLSRWLE